MSPDAAASAAPPAGLIQPRLEVGEPLSPEAVLAIPLFEGFSRTKLEKNPGTIVRRVFDPGEIICREGDFGSTAFFVLEGTAEVYLRSQIGHVAKRARPGLFRRLRSFLSRERDEARADSTRRFIPIDAPVDLDVERPTAEIGAGDLFGEMACLSFYPRSATVRARTRVVAVEMLRNILTELQRNAKFRAALEEKYRERALDQHLASVALLEGLSKEFVDRLRPKVKLLRFDPGKPIFAQGDAPDGFYLVRIGFVKVSQARPGGEIVLAYLPRGSCFGEMALLSDAPRTASCTALDHVEVVKIEGEDFRAMLAGFPAIAARLKELAAQREEQNRALAQRGGDVDLEQFLSQGLMQAQNLLLLDLDRCTRCDECVRGCASAHGGVTRLIRDGLRFDQYLVATSCRACRDPLCMVGCPVGAIRRKESLEIVIEDWCIGCNLCAKQCPYGNINMVELAAAGDERGEAGEGGAARQARPKSKATTCDLCMDQGEPACVASCPHDAAHRIDPVQFFTGRG